MLKTKAFRQGCLLGDGGFGKVYKGSILSTRKGLHRTLAATMLVLLVTVQWFANGNPEEDLVTRLPGQLTVGFRQYAGYVNVDSESNRNLFYYFVEAAEKPDNKPLTLWLSGGPGCSSVGGAFIEMGPFYPTGDGRGLRINPLSWNKVSNMLFVDSPAGVGWSYSDTSSDYNTGDKNTATDMLTFLLRWFNKFPELKSRHLFLTGESYAGHYIPQLAEEILSYNSRSSGFKINVKGIALGNPLLKVDVDVSARYEYLWSHGMISDELMDSITRECNFSTQNITTSCGNAMNNANVINEYINDFDVLLDLCDPAIAHQNLRLNRMATKMSMGVDVCLSFERQFYFNLPQVQDALHANQTHLPYEWYMCTNFLNYSAIYMNIDMLPVLKRILQHKIPVWIFSGDQNSIIPLRGSRTSVRELARDINFKITVPFGAWFHKDKVGGWVTEYGNLLTFATVRGVGHMVAFGQPSRSLHLVGVFVSCQRLPNTPKLSIV